MRTGLDRWGTYKRGENECVIIYLGPLTLKIKARPQLVSVKTAPGKIALHSAGPIATEDARGHAVVDQISGLVRMKGKSGVSGEGSDLVIQMLAQYTLQRQYAVIVLFELCFANFGRGEVAHAEER